MPVASLNTAWFALIGLLWAGYFVLEGFDFGVGILTSLVARDEVERRLCLNSIGPTWDANEVWLLVAGGATFAAFPTWYATMFSGFYLALFLVLVGLIVRGVSIEFRGRRRSPAWRATWDRARFWGSLLPALLWGVAFTDLVHGLPIRPGGLYYGGLLGLVHPIAILGGLVSLSLFSLHGAVFLSAKTSGELAARARRWARWLAGPTVILTAGLLVWLGVSTSSTPVVDGLPAVVPLVLGALAVGAVALAFWASGRHRDGVAFAATAGAVLGLAAAAFSELFPRVMVSTVAGGSLTIWNAASAHETLFVMTVVAAIFTPFVLAYQGWSYWVFRQRLIRPPSPPVPPEWFGGGDAAGGTGPGRSQQGVGAGP
jgi:cytochrome d ubiquinol oxidase subunit II